MNPYHYKGHRKTYQKSIIDMLCLNSKWNNLNLACTHNKDNNKKLSDDDRGGIGVHKMTCSSEVGLHSKSPLFLALVNSSKMFLNYIPMIILQSDTLRAVVLRNFFLYSFLRISFHEVR